MEVRKRGKFWAMYDDKGKMVCLAIYRKGALEIIRRLKDERGKDNVFKIEHYR